MFLAANMLNLQQLAFRSLLRGKGPKKEIIVCIDVDDPTWTFLVNKLMPDQNWDEIRAKGMKPVARGSLERADISKLISLAIPSLGKLLEEDPKEGFFWAVVLTDGGGSLYEILPLPDGKNKILA